MREITNQCSQNLQTTSLQSNTGADIHITTHSTGSGAGEYPGRHQEIHQEVPVILPAERTRHSSAVWEARQELIRHGLTVVSLRTGSQVMLDLIAWDENNIYGIAVRRIRKDTGIRDIMNRFDSLIQELRTILVPARIEIQLWICIHHSFRVYNVLLGGLMGRSMP